MCTGPQPAPKQQGDEQKAKQQVEQQPPVVASAAEASKNGAAAEPEQSPASASTEKEVDAAKSDEYTETMNRKMGTSLTYRHELGIDYNRILPDLIVGSCLQAGATLLLHYTHGCLAGVQCACQSYAKGAIGRHGTSCFCLPVRCRPLRMWTAWQSRRV
jgi:hypothetical protein